MSKDKNAAEQAKADNDASAFGVGATLENADGSIEHVPLHEILKQPRYRTDCPDCHGTGRVQRYVGHPGRVAEFPCFWCTEAAGD
jgi:hypothetical protein